jgi:simple sugar transport system ATP-binding protein
MLGAELGRADASTHSPGRTGDVVFRADRLMLVDGDGRVRVRDASFIVRGGEIIGVVGVEGAGQRELLRALAGRSPVAGGFLERPSHVGFVPEDRHHDAVLLDRPLYENVALRGAGAQRGLMRWSAIRRRTEALMRAFDVRAGDARVTTRTLSGGNQQKLVLARELDEREPEAHGARSAIVAENPTRGLDVRATADVHARLRAARDGGGAVVVYSSDLDEVLALASRVLVAHAGTIRETASDRSIVGRAMLGLD